VNYLVVLDGDGDRLIAKYYDRRAKADQIKNETLLHKKTKNVVAKADGEYLWTYWGLTAKEMLSL
jgi:prophage maintenance system killer protein